MEEDLPLKAKLYVPLACFISLKQHSPENYEIYYIRRRIIHLFYMVSLITKVQNLEVETVTKFKLL